MLNIIVKAIVALIIASVVILDIVLFIFIRKEERKK